jgi:hypothetical protein
VSPVRSESVCSTSRAQLPSSKETAAYFQIKLQAQRQTLFSQTKELQGLKLELAQTERALDDMTHQVGARSQRVDVGTMSSNLGQVQQVGAEMAAAIRKRQERRKIVLSDRLQKSQKMLDADNAFNRQLRQEIDERRATRLAHQEAMRKGSQHVEDMASAISSIIVASQRAYAERDTCVAKIADARRELAQRTVVWREEIAHIDQELRECNGRVADRERETEAAEVAAGLIIAALQREGEAKEKELERYAAVCKQRLELNTGLVQIFNAVNVSTVEELGAVFGALSASILSLWQKHASQVRARLGQGSAQVGQVPRREGAGSHGRTSHGNKGIRFSWRAYTPRRTRAASRRFRPGTPIVPTWHPPNCRISGGGAGNARGGAPEPAARVQPIRRGCGRPRHSLARQYCLPGPAAKRGRSGRRGG